MDDALPLPYPPETWDAGFEGGRYVVLSHLWPFIRLYERPPAFRRQFWHSVHELPIRDWTIPLATLHLGQLCVVEAELNIRYQPTLRYANDHLEFIGDLCGQVESSLKTLLKDIAEQEIKRMETESAWLSDGCDALEKTVADIVNEVLLLRGVRCRSQCRIEPHFAAVDAVDLDALPPWTRHQAIYEDFLRRRREAQERILKEQTEEAATTRRLLLEREATLLELAKREEAQRHAKQRHELESLQAALAAEEARLREQRLSQARTHEEDASHQAELRQLEAAQAWQAQEAELEQVREHMAVAAAQLAERLENDKRLRERQWRHEAELREQQEAIDRQAREVELARQQAALAVEASRQMEELASQERLQEERLRHEALLRQRQTEAELQAMQADLEILRAELATETAQQTERQSHELRRREDQLLHENWLRQMQAEAEIRAKETELDSLRLAEAARLAKQREAEARERGEQLRHEAYLRQLQASAEVQAKELQLDNLRGEMAKIEAQLERQREYEARQHAEQLRHDAQMRQLQTELEMAEKERRAPAVIELEAFLNREIGMLAMERQRLRLEEEIREAKLARTRSLLSRTKRRIGLEAALDTADGDTEAGGL
ncbi:MAG: hypothetical protein ACKN9T_13420 [Candidatus Methylumidiphilus sp.]